MNKVVDINRPSNDKRFTMLPHEFLRGNAFLSVTPVARAILLDMSARHSGFNNGEISYSLTDTMRCARCSRSTALRVMKELQGAGLIERTQRGGFSFRCGKRVDRPSKWRLPFLDEG